MILEITTVNAQDLNYETLKTVLTVLATLIISAVVKYVLRWGQYRKPIRVYKCFEETPSGFEFGWIKHSYGEVFLDASSDSKQVWKHTPYNIDGGACTMYGPYAADFGEPGKYVISFRIKILGITEDLPELINLEVVKCHFQMVNRGSNPSFEHTHQTPIIRKSYTGKDIFKGNGEYREFNLECYIPSDGIFEYRAWITRAFDATHHTILFDWIKVSRSHTFLDILFSK